MVRSETRHFSHIGGQRNTAFLKTKTLIPERERMLHVRQGGAHAVYYPEVGWT